MSEQVTIRKLYTLEETLAKPLLEKLDYPWEALPQIGDFIKELGKTLPADVYEEREENVWIAKSAKIYPNNYIAGPCIIGERTEVRPGAFIRGNALMYRFHIIIMLEIPYWGFILIWVQVPLLQM